LEISKEEKILKKPAMQLKNVTKKIGDRTIIDNLTFDVYPGV